MNYRKFYEEKLGITLEKGYDVHHIDSNRGNNDIINLVAIPKKLHIKYHNKKAKYNEVISLINDLNYFFKCENKKYFETIQSFMDIKNEISNYILIRDNIIFKNNGRRLD